MKYELNGIGKHRIFWQTKELPKFFWAGLLLVVIFSLVSMITIDERPIQLFMYIWSFLIFMLIGVIVPINLRKKIKKVIQRLEFLENKIEIETQSGISYLKNFKITKARGSFLGFGKNHTNGYIIKNMDVNKEYWLIDTFFNEIEDIEVELKKYL